jgi:hypothetical protein
MCSDVETQLYFIIVIFYSEQNVSQKHILLEQKKNGTVSNIGFMFVDEFAYSRSDAVTLYFFYRVTGATLLFLSKASKLTRL